MPSNTDTRCLDFANIIVTVDDSVLLLRRELQGTVSTRSEHASRENIYVVSRRRGPDASLLTDDSCFGDPATADKIGIDVCCRASLSVSGFIHRSRRVRTLPGHYLKKRKWDREKEIRVVVGVLTERHSSKCLPCSEIAVIGTWFPSTTTTAIDARLPVHTAAWKLLAVLLGDLPVTVPSDGRIHKLGVGPCSRLAEANRFLLSTAAADKRAFMIYIFNTFPAQRPLPFAKRCLS